MMLQNFIQKTSECKAKQEAAEVFSVSSISDRHVNANIKSTLSRESLVSWLFLIGSLIFTLDAILENLKGVSFSSLLHISASILFTIGSILFLPSDTRN